MKKIALAVIFLNGVCLAEGKFWSLRDFLLETVPLTVIGN